jgi:hypothetical protein
MVEFRGPRQPAARRVMMQPGLLGREALQRIASHLPVQACKTVRPPLGRPVLAAVVVNVDRYSTHDDRRVIENTTSKLARGVYHNARRQRRLSFGLPTRAVSRAGDRDRSDSLVLR